MKSKFYITCMSLIVFCSCTTQQSNRINNAEWLLGTWENKTVNGSIYETWTKVGNKEFNGKSYIVKEKDTIIFETIQLLQVQDSLFYIPKVKNQNEGLSVRFTLNTISDTGFVFENQQHDFPKTISYTKINTDSLVAEISGIKNGLKREQTFPMKRLN